MKLWSQLARLGGAVAALSPAVGEADHEPERAELPTLDTNNQPVAAAAIGTESVDPDANLVEDMVISPKLYVAAVPSSTQLPPPPDDRTPGPTRARPKGGAKPHADAMAHARSWHGGGQRYGG